MININLLPPEDRSGGGVSRVGVPPWLVPAGGGLALALLVSSLTLKQIQDMSATREEIGQLEREKDRYARQLSLIQDVTRQKDDLTNRLRAAQALDTGRGYRVEVMVGVLQALPPSLWLATLEEQGGRVRITGRAVNTMSVFEFMTGLETSATFDHVTLTYLKRDPEIDGGAADFLIEMGLT